MHPLDDADDVTASEHRALGLGTNFADNFVERLVVGDGPVNKLAVHIVSHKNLLGRARLLFRTRDKPRCPLLQQAENFRGNLDHVLLHVSTLLHFSIARLFFRIDDADAA
jgi:hypothetical protein